MMIIMLKYLVGNNKNADFNNLESALLQAKEDSKLQNSNKEIKILIDGFLPILSKFNIKNDLLPEGDYPITIEGLGENSGFDGGIKIQNMTHWKDNIWRVYLPEVEYTRHLYIDGKLAKRPSTPYKKSTKWNILESDNFEFFDLPDDICEEGYHSGIATTYENIAEMNMTINTFWINVLKSKNF